MFVEFRRDAVLAEQSKKVVNGIREQCFLNGILEIPDDVPIDAMHQFLGCAESLICGLMTAVAKGDARVLSEHLSGVKSPTGFLGKPKQLNEIKYWKARDFKFFLLHYGSFCLQDLVGMNRNDSFNKLSGF